MSLGSRVSPSAVPADALTAIIADIGSPDAMMEGGGQSAPINAYNDLSTYWQKTSGKPISYIVPVEMGAVSTLIPFIVASRQAGISVVDGDPCGRAVPELSMTLYTIAKLPVSPVILDSDTLKAQQGSSAGKYSACLFWAKDVYEAEDCARAAIGLSVFKEIAGLGCYTVPGSALRAQNPKPIIEGTVSDAIAVGNLLERYKDPAAFKLQLDWAIQDTSYLLVSGKITAKVEKSAGFDVGQIKIKADNGDDWVISYMNESLYIQNLTEGKTHAMGPDLICYRTADGRPFSNADIDTTEVPIGTAVTIFGLKCNGGMRCDAMVAMFDSAIKTMFEQLGIPRPDPKYVPIENLNK
jgi:DUF917 family protein